MNDWIAALATNVIIIIIMSDWTRTLAMHIKIVIIVTSYVRESLTWTGLLLTS